MTRFALICALAAGLAVMGLTAAQSYAQAAETAAAVAGEAEANAAARAEEDASSGEEAAASAEEPAAAVEDSAAVGDGEAAGQTAEGAALQGNSAMEALLFYIVGGVAALSALGCVLSVNIVRMATCLFGTLGSVAILYFLMGAYYVGAIQLIVYAGGTLIVIIFGVMLTSQAPWMKFMPRRSEWIGGGMVFTLLFAGLVWLLTRNSWTAVTQESSPYPVALIGEQLLTTYLVPFEVASVLLLAVMVGAAYLARRER